METLLSQRMLRLVTFNVLFKIAHQKEESLERMLMLTTYCRISKLIHYYGYAVSMTLGQDTAFGKYKLILVPEEGVWSRTQSGHT